MVHLIICDDKKVFEYLWYHKMCLIICDVIKVYDNQWWCQKVYLTISDDVKNCIKWSVMSKSNW